MVSLSSTSDRITTERDVQKIDGVTSGPRTYQGEIGKEIQPDLRTLQMVKFEKIFGKVEEIQDQVLHNLSSDQKYLYEVALSVQTGKFPIRLATRSPGTLNEARWLTKANRILRLYVSTHNPSSNLVKLVSFILNLYAPAWCKIKSNTRAVDGTKNFFTSYVCYPNYRKMIRSFVNQLYFAMHTFHTESILLACVNDPDIKIGTVAIDRILHQKQTRSQRDFIVPDKINWNAV